MNNALCWKILLNSEFLALPPVLVPRNPQPMSAPMYDSTRFCLITGQPVTPLYSPHAKRSPPSFDYPGMITSS